MKTVNVVKAAVGEGVSDDAQEMMIDEASSVFLMDALGKLYSQPARAALREYLANGIDAHIEAGGNRPAIQVKLPNIIEGDLTLSIRDYGNGMSEEQFGSILRRYGASTKRHSNNLTGGFGLGAKAGFAIADEFYMTSYQNGLELRVHIFKNAEGKGFIEVVERNRTSQPDGMLVEVVVPASNVPEVSLDSLEKDKFFEAYKASDVAIEGPHTSYVRYGHGKSTTIRMLDLEATSLHEPDNYDTLEYGGSVVGWYSKNDSSRYHRSGPIRAIIGRVTYEINWDDSHSNYSNNNQYSDKFGKHLQALNNLSGQIVLNLPIGSVDLPSSREEITYSERTLRTITAVAESVHRVLEEQFQRNVNACATGYDALREIIKMYSSGYWKAAELTWRGKVPPLLSRSSRSNDATPCFTQALADIIRYTKSPDGRPSLAVNSLTSLETSVVRFWGEKDHHEFMMVAEDEEEFLLASKKITTTIADYRKAIISDYSPLVSIILVKATDPNLLWIEHGKRITLTDFLADTRKYRAAQRAASKPVRPTGVAVPKNSTRQASWISLSKDAIARFPLPVRNDDEFELLEGQSNFYYLSKSEVTGVSNLLQEMTPVRRNGAMTAQIHDGHKSLLAALRGILGEEANIVFLPGNRKMEDFHASFPNVPSVATAIKEKLQKEWEEVRDNGKKNTYLQIMFWNIPHSHRIVNIHRFAESLTDGERVSLNSDIKELMEYMPYESRTLSNAVPILFQELLGAAARNEVVNWIDLQASAVVYRYPLLTQMSLYGSEWSALKGEMLRYLKTC